MLDPIDPTPFGPAAPLSLAQGVMLVSAYKPILVLAVFAAWAWVVSSFYDKDAARWYFQRQTWNLAHVVVAVVGVGVVLGVDAGPYSFWITWPIMIVLLGVDLLVYFHMRNADDRVPDTLKWSLNPAVWFEAAREEKEKKRKTGDGHPVLTFMAPDGELAPPEPDTPELQVRLAAEELFKQLIDMRGSQLDIMPARDQVYAAVAMVDGVKAAINQLPGEQARAVIDLYKAAAGLDVGDRRRRQRGRAKIGMAGTKLLDVGVACIGGSSGMRLTLRIDPVGQVTRDLDELGLLPNQLAELESIINDGTGVVIQAAPADHGRTTTFYALVRKHDAYTSNVQTLEIEPEAAVEGVRHNEFDPAIDGAEFATTVRSILRRDPDVLGVGDIPDPETTQEMVRADLERTRVYASFRADHALAAIARWTSEVGDDRAAADALRGVIAQKLVRRLCHNCKVPFEPTPDILKKLGLPPDTRQLFRKSGKVLIKDKEETCPVCNGVGYFGQVGVFAVHAIGPEERDLIAAGDLQGLRGLFRQKKQQSIQTAGLQQVLAGVTSVDELLRVVTPPQPRRRSSGSSEAA